MPRAAVSNSIDVAPTPAAPPLDALSSSRLWRAISSDFSTVAREELRDGAKWKRLLAAISEVSGEDLSAQLLARVTTWVSAMPAGLIRAIDEQKQWQSLAKVAHRIDLRDHTYFKVNGGLELTKEMLSTVPKPKAGDLLAIMANYDGNPAYLKSFLDIIGQGERNPFLVARGIQVEFAEATDKPTLTVQPQPAHPTALGQEGQQLEGFRVMFKAAQPSARFVAGPQATLKIAEAFWPEEFGAEPREKCKREREQIDNSELAKLSLDDLLDAPEKGAGSRLLVRKLDVYRELLAEIKRMRGEISHAVYSDALSNFSGALSEMRTYSGGRWISWMRENRAELPPEVRTALTLLDDPLVRSTKAQRIDGLKTIVGYYVSNVAVISHASIEPLLEDTRRYAELQSDATRLKKLGVPENIDVNERLGKIATILQKNELHFPEVAYVTAQLSFALELRSALFKEEYQRYADSLRKAKTLGQRLFQEQSTSDTGAATFRWREDSMGKSIPLDRLTTTTVEAAKVGTRAANSSREKVAVLHREELAALKDLLELETLAPSIDIRSRVRSISAAFKMMQTAIVGVRKVDDLYRTLAQAGKPANEAGYSEAEITALAKGSLTVLNGRDYFPKEDFAAEKFGNRSVDELLIAGNALAEERYSRKIDWTRQLPLLKREAQAGLVNTNDQALRSIALALTRFTPASQLLSEIEQAREMQASPFFGYHQKKAIDLGEVRIPPLNQTFYASDEVETTKSLAALHAAVKSLDLKKIQDLRQELESWNARTVFSRASDNDELTKNSAVVGLGEACKMTNMEFKTDGTVTCTFVSFQPYTRAFAYVYDEQLMQQAIDRRMKQFIPVSTLAREFRDAFERILNDHRVRSRLWIRDWTPLEKELNSPDSKAWISVELKTSIEKAARRR